MLIDDIKAVSASAKLQAGVAADMAAMAKAMGEGPLMQAIRSVNLSSLAVTDIASSLGVLGEVRSLRSLRIMEDARKAALAAGRLPSLPPSTSSALAEPFET